MLAVHVRLEDGREGVALADLRRAEASLIRGPLSASTAGALAWVSSGDWLFALGGDGSVAAYRAGSKAAVRMRLSIPYWFGLVAS